MEVNPGYQAKSCRNEVCIAANVAEGRWLSKFRKECKAMVIRPIHNSVKQKKKKMEQEWSSTRDKKTEG